MPAVLYDPGLHRRVWQRKRMAGATGRYGAHDLPQVYCSRIPYPCLTQRPLQGCLGRVREWFRPLSAFSTRRLLSMRPYRLRWIDTAPITPPSSHGGLRRTIASLGCSPFTGPAVIAWSCPRLPAPDHCAYDSLMTPSDRSPRSPPLPCQMGRDRPSHSPSGASGAASACPEPNPFEGKAPLPVEAA